MRSFLTSSLLLAVLCQAAAGIQIRNGQTDVTTYFVLRDATNHAPKTDVTVTDIDLYYVEHRAAISAKADASALAAADSAHGDSSAFHVGQGLYRIDWPDAAFDGGIGTTVQLIVVCTGVDTTFLEVELSPPANLTAIDGQATAGNNATLNLKKLSVINPDGVAVEFRATGGAGSEGSGLYLSAATGYGIECDNGISGTLQDKSGFTLAAAYDAAKTAAQAGDAMTLTAAYDAAKTAAPASTALSNATWTDARAAYLDAAISTRLSTASYTAPDNASIAAILADTGTDGVVIAAGQTVATVTSVTNGVTLADDAITAAKFDETTAFPLKSADTGATAVARTGADADTLETLSDQLDAVSAPSAEDVADAVWDEILAGHAIVGSTGAALSAAGGSGDPWSTALPGAYGAGTAGYLVGTYLDAAISTRLSTAGYTAPDNASIAAILADTGTDGVVVAAASKTGYALTAAYDAAQTAAQAGDAMTLTAAYDAAKTAAPSSTALSNATWTDAKAAFLDVAISTRLATAGYTAPDNASIAAILADTGELQTDWADGGRLDLLLDAAGGGSDPATIADAVWDEILAGHAIVGSTGAALSAAGGSGDPWSTALPGAYGAGTAGYLIGQRLDATISSRAAAATSVTVSAPVATTGDISLVQGMDYTADNAVSLSGTYAVDVTGGTAVLRITPLGPYLAGKDATATDLGTAAVSYAAGQVTVSITIDAAETADLATAPPLRTPNFYYEVQITLADKVYKPFTGHLTLVRGID